MANTAPVKTFLCLVASSHSTCRRGCVLFLLEEYLEEGIGKLGFSILLSNGEDIDKTVSCQECTVQRGQKLLNKPGTKKGTTGYKKIILRVVKHWRRMPKEAVPPSSLEIFSG